MNFSAEIKQRLSTREVFEFYGFYPNRNGFVCCFSHSEKTPSMKLYPEDRGYHCFGCGVSGDIIDFVRQYFSLSYKQAIEKLNDDFALGLPIGQHTTAAERLSLQRDKYLQDRRKAAQKAREDAIEQEYYDALGRIVILERNKAQFAPADQDEDFDPRFVEAICCLDNAYYNLGLAEAKRSLCRKK